MKLILKNSANNKKYHAVDGSWVLQSHQSVNKLIQWVLSIYKYKEMLNLPV